jgi:hypothetical protein
MKTMRKEAAVISKKTLMAGTLVLENKGKCLELSIHFYNGHSDLLAIVDKKNKNTMEYFAAINDFEYIG